MERVDRSDAMDTQDVRSLHDQLAGSQKESIPDRRRTDLLIQGLDDLIAGVRCGVGSQRLKQIRGRLRHDLALLPVGPTLRCLLEIIAPRTVGREILLVTTAPAV